MKTSTLTRSVPMILGAALAVPAMAQTQTSFDFGGYFRAGPQASTKNSNRTCYQLSGSEFKYRLGNECEGYGEFLLTGTVKQATGETFKVFFMPAVSSTTIGSDPNSSVTTAQMYAEMSGLDFAPDMSFWGGKRYHRGADVHIVDKFFEQLDGTGAGASLPAMGGKLDLAFYRKDDTTNAAGAQQPGSRFNAWLRDVPVNAGGTVNVVLNYVNADFDGGKSGTALSVRHTQSGLLGGGINNNLWFQASQGSAGLTGNFGTLTDGSDVKKWRIVDGIQGQLSTNVGFQAIAMYQSNKADAGDSTITTLGGRLSYAFTRNFKLLTDLGIDRVKPQGGSAANLTKLTIAPTLSTGPGLFNRPELRFYVTTAKWNDGANSAAVAAGKTGGLNGVDNKTSGTSYGVQAEVWF